MKKIFVVIFLVILISGLAFFGVKEYRKSNTNQISNSSKQNISNSVTVTTIPSETSAPTNPVTNNEWLTYKNDKYGISFQYPKDWYAKDVTKEAPGDFLLNIGFFKKGTKPDLNAAQHEGNGLLYVIVLKEEKTKQQFLDTATQINYTTLNINGTPLLHGPISKDYIVWYSNTIQIRFNPYLDGLNFIDDIIKTIKIKPTN